MVTKDEYLKAKEAMDQYEVEARERIRDYKITQERQDEILLVLSNYVPTMILHDEHRKHLFCAIDYLCKNYKS